METKVRPLSQSSSLLSQRSVNAVVQKRVKKIAAAAAEKKQQQEALVAKARAEAQRLAQPPEKRRRRNWSKGEHKKLLERAVASVLNRNDLFKPGTSVFKFAQKVNIPHATLTTAIKRAKTKAPRPKRGRPSLMSVDLQDVLIDAVTTMDELGHPANRKTVIAMCMNAMGWNHNDPKQRKQANNMWKHTILPRGRKQGKLTGLVTAQAGTDGRTAAAGRASAALAH